MRARASPSHMPELSAAPTEPMRAAVGHTVPGGAPAERPGPGWKALLWLAVAGAAAGVAGAWAAGASIQAPMAVAIAVVPGAAVGVPLHCLPMIIAYRRSAPDRGSVTVINVFLGWTYVGWVAALALAARDRRPRTDVPPAPGTLREPGSPAMPTTGWEAAAARKPGAAAAPGTRPRRAAAGRMYHRQGGPLCSSEGRPAGLGELTAAVSGVTASPRAVRQADRGRLSEAQGGASCRGRTITVARVS
jgi:T4 superinfection immunity protein